MDMNERKKRLKKLRKILNLAQGNVNKAEALASISKAMAYAAQYGLSLAEAEDMKDFSEYGKRSAYSGTKNYGYVDRYLWKDIAKFCHCKVGVEMDEDGDHCIVFFGHEADVDIAFWLRGNIRAAMKFEYEIYRDFVASGRQGVDARDSFHLGFANEVRERMGVVDAAPKTSDSTALVVKKWEIVNAAAKEAGFVEAQGSAGRRVNHDGNAYAAGSAAGRRVNLGRGVSGNGSVKMIGR